MLPIMRPPDDAGPPRLLIVDDHELVRLGLATLIAAHAGGHTAPQVLEAGSLAQALACYSVHGSTTRKRVPRAWRERSCTVSPSRRDSRCTMDRPMPRPCARSRPGFPTW